MPNFDQQNQRYKDFTVTKHLPIKEINVDLIELTHKSGAQVLQIANDDDENLFSLSFKTLPDSSNGAAHILEHTVLCGSKKFPVKDPFFSMLRRSLNTFMNAMTGSDFTCYPASSQVEIDFYNLMEVYIDAVFYPNLNKLSFLQEGHRLEFSDPEDASSDLVYKGIVYNEMKGSMSSIDSRLWHYMMEKLTPDLPYAYNSGGDPKEIPNLSYQNLLDFHKKFYHPSRCLFFFYGNIDLKKHLDFIDENILKHSEKLPPIAPIKKQKRFTKPIEHTARYPIPENEDTKGKTIVSFGYLMCPIENQEDLLAISVIDLILMGTDASILKLTLLKSGLCKQVDSMMDLETTEIPYLITCKGTDRKNKDAIFTIIQKTLKHIIDNNIPQNIVNAAIHQIEFSRSEISADYGPYGLTIFFKSGLLKQHGCNSENALLIHSLFNSLREKIKDPTYLPSLIKKYFLENTHIVKISMEPSHSLEQEEKEEERSKLDKIQENLTPSDIENILSQTAALKKQQEELETKSIECLPKIHLKDIPKNIKEYPLNEEKINNFTIFHHNCFTNNIVYADLIFELPKIMEDDLCMLSLFSSILCEVGAGDRDYISNLEYTQAYTGGIASYISLHNQANDPNKLKPTFVIRSKALIRNVDKMFYLIKDITSSAIFDDKNRIKELLLQQYTHLENTLINHAMLYAKNLSLSSTLSSYISNLFHGLYYFQFLRSLIKDLDKNLDGIIQKLKSFQNKVLLLENPHLVLSCSDDDYNVIKQNNFYSLLDLKLQSYSPFVGDYKIPSIPSQARIIAAPVSFNASGFESIGFSHQEAPALLVATNLLENKVLHKKIREEGGAYGSGVSYSPTSASFAFHSYRDPNISNTFNAFDFSINEIVNGNFTDQDLEEAKLGLIQHADVPVSVDSRAITAYSWIRSGKTKETRQAFRDKILSSSKEDIIKAIKNNLIPQKQKATDVAFCGKDLIEKENKLLKKQLKEYNI